MGVACSPLVLSYGREAVICYDDESKKRIDHCRILSGAR